MISKLRQLEQVAIQLASYSDEEKRRRGSGPCECW